MAEEARLRLKLENQGMADVEAHLRLSTIKGPGTATRAFYCGSFTKLIDALFLLLMSCIFLLILRSGNLVWYGLLAYVKALALLYASL